MSILLDALKKSERRQRIGQVPTIDMDPSGSDDPGRRLQGWAWLVIAIPVFVAIGWLTWRQYAPLDREPDDRAGATAKAAAPAETSTPAAAEVPAEPGERGTPDAGRAPLRTPVDTVAAHAPTDGDGPAAPDPAAEEQGVPAPRGVEAEADRADTAASTRPSVPQPQPASDAGGSAVPVQPARRESPDDVLGYWELPASVRNEFPQVGISVLVYADQPEHRFALANGTRVREGDELSRRLIVDEIRRDGVVFRYGAYRFLVEP